MKKSKSTLFLKLFGVKDVDSKKLSERVEAEFQNYKYLATKLPITLKSSLEWVWYPPLKSPELVTIGDFKGFLIEHGGQSLLSQVSRKGPLNEFFENTTNKHFKHKQVLSCMKGFGIFIQRLSHSKLVHFDISPGNCIVIWNSQEQKFTNGYLVDYASLSTNNHEVKYVTFTRMFLSYHHLESLEKNPSQTLIANTNDDIESLFLTFLYLVNPSLPIFQLKGRALLDARLLFMNSGDTIGTWKSYFSVAIPARFKSLVLLFSQLADTLFTKREPSKAYDILQNYAPMDDDD